MVYLQHPSDPIVWWTPKLMLSRPDWLAERRGSDVLPSMRWLPFVTFWQVTADMAFSTGVSDGHGHSYGTAPAAARAAIAPPTGWTAE
ncbi:alpha/beta-hydrolase family protein [Dactylosporangium sp. McL0621]|uniref:alpha/beta-hydrolase family protein n=1 Tax=Dactylosporangium sp. McL0621 TaxID=3415678 RepID=UPI003CEC0A48